MRRFITSRSLGGPLEQKLAAAARAGFDGVEIVEAELLGCALSPTEIAARAAGHGLAIEAYRPSVPPELTERRVRHILAVMTELGAGVLTVAARADPALAERLHRLAGPAAEAGIRVAVEADARARHDAPRVWRTVADTGHPGLGVSVDGFHILTGGADPAAGPHRVLHLPAERILAVKLADALPVHTDSHAAAGYLRRLPGEGVLDLAGLLGHVLATGYRGAVTLDVPGEADPDPERAAANGMRALIALEDDLLSRTTTATARPPTQVTERSELAQPAAPAEPSGAAFVEISAGPLAEPSAENLLRRSGFVHVADHRTEPVRMWRQGEARVLLRRVGTSVGQDLSISALGIAVGDPERCATLARRLPSPALPRSSGSGDPGPFAAAAPGGVEVLFCQSGADPSWLKAFEPLPPVPPDGSASLTHIDHVTLSRPPHALDEAALFYRSVLGLRPHEHAEGLGVFRPNGPRALSAGGIRLVLRVPAPTGGLLPETAPLQHIAFGCDDIFTAAVAMRIRDLPMPAIPDNYYRDLAARFDLDDDAIEAMRSFGVLYDRDAHGEFFHFHTAVLGRRIFFETVQRVNGYDGYGATNAGVRVAAQHRRMALADLSW
ncbi:TIM barrel protein [Phytomonospora sp. NPDC050363]|uniref:sugar phosphate isomerase/epimerase and 4-hydroxyphenylpyruvate domain-containing protein n=1 Tax=Phytomonospora sp. NPDC050363 TaxID=3155642 RepID=UPI0033C865C0